MPYEELNTYKKFAGTDVFKNQFRINLSEIEDKEYRVSPEDKKLNNDFYGK